MSDCKIKKNLEKITDFYYKLKNKTSDLERLFVTFFDFPRNPIPYGWVRNSFHEKFEKYLTKLNNSSFFSFFFF